MTFFEESETRTRIFNINITDQAWDQIDSTLAEEVVTRIYDRIMNPVVDQAWVQIRDRVVNQARVAMGSKSI